MPATSKRSRGKSRAADSPFLRTRNSKRLRISIVGAGRLGTTLGCALRRAGHRIEVVVTSHRASARRAAPAIDKGSLPLTSRQIQKLSSAACGRLFASDLILIATPDAAIETVAQQLAKLFRKHGSSLSRESSRVALHTSGAISSEALARLKSFGFAVGSWHPLVSVADTKSAAHIFRDVHFCIEGDRQAVRLARTLVKQLDGHSFTISPKSKPLYHAAAVMASGHIVALFDMAIEMLMACGLSASTAQEALVPLMNSATLNLAKKAVAQALTGPFVRGDFETVKKHLDAIRAAGMAEALSTYTVLGQRALRLARTSKPNLKDLDAMTKLLSSNRKGGL